MTRRFIKPSVLALGLGASSLLLTACDGVSVGVGVGYGYDPFYDSMLWNDYYHDVDVDIDVNRPVRPDRPNRPGGQPPTRPRPPVAKPPVTRPPAARPPIHRPAPRRR
nr:hypothetical protein [uncultured Ruegeria sp.]